MVQIEELATKLEELATETTDAATAQTQPDCEDLFGEEESGESQEESVESEAGDTEEEAFEELCLLGSEYAVVHRPRRQLVAAALPPVTPGPALEAARQCRCVPLPLAAANQVYTGT